MLLSLSARRLTIFLGLSTLLLLSPCAPVLAHAQLLRSEPEDGATSVQAPNQVRLSFNEPIEAEFDPIKVLDQQGNRVDQDNAHLDPDDRKTVVADLKALSKGTYMVQWRVISADTHPVNGSYEFYVDGASADEPQAAIQSVSSKGQSSDQAEPGSDSQQDTSGWSAHIVHVVGLGLGALVVLALALLRKL